MLRSCARKLHQRVPELVPALSCGACRGAKQTTGIVGIEVEPEARSLLKQTAQEVLSAVKAIPDSAEYRRSVESTMNYRYCTH